MSTDETREALTAMVRGGVEAGMYAPDHGSARFCTNHSQAPDGRTETVARVLREHDWDGDETLNLGYYRTEATCLCGITYWGGDHDEDPSLADALIAHQAAAVVAALDDETARGRASADAWWSEYDRELTAHEATKAEVTAARAALDRVVALHKPVWDGARGVHCCAECGADLTDATPDCPTVAALDPEEPR